MEGEFEMDIMKMKTKTWLVKVGDLYYVGGLNKICIDNEKFFSSEFCNSESIAFPFLIKEGAEYVANFVGGTTIEIELTDEELYERTEKYEQYIENTQKGDYH